MLKQEEKLKEELEGRMKESCSKRKKGEELISEDSVAWNGREGKKEKMTSNEPKKDQGLLRAYSLS